MNSAAVLSSLTRTPTEVQLVAFSAATWNLHRIHYDAEYARSEGYPDVLVQSHLHACFLVQAIRNAFGGDVTIERFGWQNRSIAVPGDELTVTCEAVEQGPHRFEVSLAEHNQDGELCVTGWATVVQP